MTAPVLVPAELLHRLIVAAEGAAEEHYGMVAGDEYAEAVALARGLLAGAELDAVIEPDAEAVILDLTLAVGRDVIEEAPATSPFALARYAAERAGLDPDIVQQHPNGGLYVRLPRP